jgi:hypothetical protein
MRSLFDLVNRMKAMAGQTDIRVMEAAMNKMTDPDALKKREKFSGLAIPDDFEHVKKLTINSPKKEEEIVEEEVDDMMTLLEGTLIIF